MKNLFRLSMLLLLIAFAAGCQKEDSDPKTDENGLTPEINNLIPAAILDEMKNLGMPINGGNKPPIIEATYLISPFVLIKSNIPDDNLGDEFEDDIVTFKNQNNKDLSVMVNYVNGTLAGQGIGSFIVGDGAKFSVFVELKDYEINGDSAKSVDVISGEVAPNGIKNLHYATFMINNYGNISGVWIENGEGRIFYDKDGLSERL